jgi:AAA domain
MRMLTAAERLAEPRGAKIAIFGPAGVGKTSLLRTLPEAALAETLFIDIEGGDQAVADLPVASMRPERWTDCLNIAAVAGGPDPSLPVSEPYSEAHHRSASAGLDLSAYQILFVDSITAAARLCFRWCQQQPETYSDRGRRDLRAVYGLHGRTMIGWLNQLQRARERAVIFVGILEKVVDDFNVATWESQLEGAKTARELPGIVDQLITYHWIDRGDGKPVRTLVCTSPNSRNVPAKDRSGRLSQFEEPDLARLLTKLTPPITEKQRGENA